MIEILVVLAVLALMAFGFFGFVFLGAASKADKRAKADAPQILNTVFDGKPRATYRTGIGKLPYQDVILGAEKRGYRLTHQTEDKYSKTLIFARD